MPDTSPSVHHPAGLDPSQIDVGLAIAHALRQLAAEWEATLGRWRSVAERTLGPWTGPAAIVFGHDLSDVVIESDRICAHLRSEADRWLALVDEGRAVSPRAVR